MSEQNSSCRQNGTSSLSDPTSNNPFDGTSTRIAAEAEGVNPPSNESDPMVTRSSVPQISDRALDIASCSASMETDLSLKTDMGISPERVGGIVGRLALVFPMNTERDITDGGRGLCEVYANLLADIPADECEKAFATCAKTLTRFPYPADIRRAAGLLD